LDIIALTEFPASMGNEERI